MPLPTQCDDCVNQLKRTVTSGRSRTSKKKTIERTCLKDSRHFKPAKGAPFEKVSNCTQYEQLP